MAVNSYFVIILADPFQQIQILSGKDYRYEHKNETNPEQILIACILDIKC